MPNIPSITLLGPLFLPHATKFWRPQPNITFLMPTFPRVSCEYIMKSPRSECHSTSNYHQMLFCKCIYLRHPIWVTARDHLKCTWSVITEWSFLEGETWLTSFALNPNEATTHVQHQKEAGWWCADTHLHYIVESNSCQTTGLTKSIWLFLLLAYFDPMDANLFGYLSDDCSICTYLSLSVRLPGLTGEFLEYVGIIVREKPSAPSIVAGPTVLTKGW